MGLQDAITVDGCSPPNRSNDDEPIWRWMGDTMRLEGMEPVSSKSYLQQHCNKQGYFVVALGMGRRLLGPKDIQNVTLIHHAGRVG